MNAPIVIRERTAKPIVAGVFNVVIGSICLLGVLGLIIGAAVVAPLNLVGDWPLAISALLIIIAVPLAVLGGVTLVGGVFSLQRRNWGWALAGSVAALLVSQVFGIVSTVLVAVSRDEFAP